MRLELRQRFRGRSAFRNFQFAAQLKPLHDRLKIRAFQVIGENFADGAANQFARDVFRAAQFAFVFEFHLSR